ncbi:MAG: single-stranded-DNA-specific exonuclease RecJ [Planctomycetes bacterium]|nr:single-stranded-DNA-specific exonuclease RecJ [Planctomycetota bacterium]
MARTASKPLEPDPKEGALAHTLGVPDLVARVLLARGFDDPELVRRLLRPDLRALHDPFMFRDMDKAVDRIRRAIRNGESILIHGDYDVDGITGTVLLHKFFQLLHVTSKCHIPARADGYSISKASVAAILAGGHRLVISVDNGTNACEAIDELQRRGIDVIVTDHHGTSENVAAAYAILNPRLPDSGYPDRNLAGCGVAFRLAAAIAASFSGTMLQSPEFADFLTDAVGLIALGTVADVAPLTGENRTLVFHGLRALSQSRNPGIRALLDSAGLAHRGIDTGDIAFRIAPLINAAGRMGHAIEAVQLLTAPGMAEAQVQAAILERFNEERRATERVMQDEVMRAAAEITAPAIVLGKDDWHPGVLGIVAARAAETFGKPAILISFEGGTGRGSGRCNTGLHLRDALAACSDLLESHGGHAAAVGLEVRRDNFDAFCRRFEAVCDELPANAPTFYDGPASFTDLDPHTVRRLDMLAPFGTGHPRPRFLTGGVMSVGNPTSDVRGQDLRIRVTKDGQVMPARLIRGMRRFEELRNHRGPWTLLYSPRISSRGEEGPVLLEIHEMTAEAAPSNGPATAAAPPEGPKYTP